MNLNANLKILPETGSEAGNGIKVSSGGWTFKNLSSPQFNDHIRRSVPLYEEGHKLICQISEYFVHDNSICYELGTSSGVLLSKLATFHQGKKAKFIGIDTEPNMIKEAKKTIRGLKNASAECGDVLLYPYKEADLFVSYYCIQFIPSKNRQELISRIFNALNKGGCFILFEKVLHANSRVQDMYNTLYNFDFKKAQGFKDNEIASKIRSLKGVLNPNTRLENIKMLTEAGFKNIAFCLCFLSFEGLIAIKA